MPLGGARSKCRIFAIFWLCCCWGHPCFTNTFLVPSLYSWNIVKHDINPKYTKSCWIYHRRKWQVTICCRDRLRRNSDLCHKHFSFFPLLQEVDSDDEWQGLIDQTDQEGDPDVALTLLQDAKFQNKLKSRVQVASGQVLDGMLEGAARLKTVYRVITNLVTLKW